jgi:hypothetical protein
VTFTLSRKLDGRTRLIGKLTVSLAAGERRYTLARRFDGHTLAAGTYALSAYAVASTTTSAGHRATQVSSVFRAALRVD